MQVSVIRLTICNEIEVYVVFVLRIFHLSAGSGALRDAGAGLGLLGAFGFGADLDEPLV